MRAPHIRSGHTYRLIVSGGAGAEPQVIEFEADGPDSALFRAQRQCAGLPAELFEDERSLGSIQCMQEGGYWVLSPPRRGAQARSRSVAISSSAERT